MAAFTHFVKAIFHVRSSTPSKCSRWFAAACEKRKGLRKPTDPDNGNLRFRFHRAVLADDYFSDEVFAPAAPGFFLHQK